MIPMFQVQPDDTGAFMVKTRLGYAVDAPTRNAAQWESGTGPGLTRTEAEAACAHLNRWYDGQAAPKRGAKQSV